LKQKYADRQIDVLVASSDASLDFLLKYEDLFPSVPIVYEVVKPPASNRFSGSKELTGIINLSAYRKTLDLALRLHPLTEQVFIVSGTLERDKRLEDQARIELEGSDIKLPISYLTDLAPDQLAARVESLPERSVVLYVWQQTRDSQGRLVESPEILSNFSKNAKVPIYGMSTPYIGRGAVGGYITTAEASGSQIANIAVQVINGISARYIPVEKATAVPLFDWRELKRWQISESALPAGSVLRFKEFGIWEQYGWYIVAAIVVSLLQTCLIGWLLLERRVRYRSESHRRHLAAIVDSSRDAIIGINPDGEILSWNPGAKLIYGYSAAEMVGKNLSVLVPPERMKEFRERLKNLQTGERPIEDYETLQRKKDGIDIDVSVSTCSPIPGKGDVTAFATITRDITERKEAEEAQRRSDEALRKSHSQIQELAARLIRFQDDERKRIAAELHDGLGQSLAIIRNRVTICLGNISDIDKVREQLEEIEVTTTSTIDEVREIAHNLRPYELDRLGLVHAVASMIDNVRNSSSLEVSSELGSVESILTPDRETGIYRIVQEGLSNTLKHADATKVRVSIEHVDDELIVTIQDNGRGMRVVDDRDYGFGLAGIAERSRMMGGMFKIDSEAGKGTTLIFRCGIRNHGN